jgi:predicted PurR-regulated permease PerM
MLDSMLGLSTRAARITWTVILIVILLGFVYAIRETVLVFAAALFFAYVLWPAVSFFERKTPRWLGRTLALTIVYLLFIGALIALGATVGGSLFDEANSFAQKVPELIKNRDWLEHTLPGWLGPAREQIIDWIQEQFSSGGAALLPYLKNAGAALRGTVNGVFYFVLVPILAFFFIKDGHEMREYLVGIIGDGGRRAMADDILEDIHVMLGHYIRVLVTLSLISVIVYSIFFAIAGVPYGVLLACQAALLEFIPVIGPLVAGIIMLIVAGFAGYQHLLWIVIFWGVYRMIQDYAISPHLMGKGVEIHPIVVLFGVLAGEQIGGVPGMFFSVPAIAIIRVIFVRARRAAERRRGAAVEINPP